MKDFEKIIDTILLKNGFEIDMDEGWAKLTSSQFGGSPGRAFSELIQNAIDSYPAGTPWNKRKGDIASTEKTITITDWGEGLNTKRLSLLATAGGTDKFGDENKIGRFGLGFISIFNPQLCTRRVVVITRCERQVVEMVFTVTDPNKRPEISVRTINSFIRYSTRITIEFSNYISVIDCLNFAEKSLAYYPCPMTINGIQFKSEWQTGKSGLSLGFSENQCDGIIKKGSKWYNINLLCRYELVMNSTLSHFITGGHNMKNNLYDFEANKTPFIPNIEIVFNINNLQLVISRDNYYLDSNYFNAKRLLNLKLKSFLYLELEHSPQPQVVISNQYIFGNEINSFLNEEDNRIFHFEDDKLIRVLAGMPVYRINGRPGFFSLIQLKSMLRRGLPLYYSPERTNLRWLGGSFKYDFIVIPDKYDEFPDSTILYDRLFGSVFKDVVNLDKIISDHEKIKELVDRGLVDKSALLPKCEIIGIKSLTENQKETISGLSRILNDPDIQDIISSNLKIPVGSIKPVFFSINDEGAYLSTGIFDAEGKPISEEYVSNILENTNAQNGELPKRKKPDLLLGLNLSHPFINYLVGCKASQKEYYTLTYLAHELALCLKMMVPYSPFYHLVKQKLAMDMRKALMKNLLSRLKN